MEVLSARVHQPLRYLKDWMPKSSPTNIITASTTSCMPQGQQSAHEGQDDDNNDLRDSSNSNLDLDSTDNQEQDNMFRSSPSSSSARQSHFSTSMETFPVTSTPMALISQTAGRTSKSIKMPSPVPSKKPSDSIQCNETEYMAIRCLVEYAKGAGDYDNSTCGMIEVDRRGFAFLPRSTPWTDIVPATLRYLGYTPTDAVNARGTLLLRNWKPQPITNISDNTEATIHDILKGINDFILCIHLFRRQNMNEEWGEHSVRCAVLALLKYHSQSSLAKLSPLSQSTISSIANGIYKNRLSVEKCHAFGHWYTDYVANTDFVATAQRIPIDSRMTFHPQHELPPMRSWFQAFPNPSNHRLASLAVQLNKGFARQNRTKISVQQLKTWWRNERQRQKRLQQHASAGTAFKTKLAKNELTVTQLEFHTTQNGPKGRKYSRVKAVSKEAILSHGGVKHLEGSVEKAVQVDKDVAKQHESLNSWNRTADIDVVSLASVSTQSFVPSQPVTIPTPPLFSKRPAQKLCRESAVSEITLPSCQDQGRNPLPAQHSSAWQSSFRTWANQQKGFERNSDNYFPEPNMLVPWQNHISVMVPHIKRSRARHEQEVATSGSGSFGQVECYQYSKDVTFGATSSMDVTNSM